MPKVEATPSVAPVMRTSDELVTPSGIRLSEEAIPLRSSGDIFPRPSHDVSLPEQAHDNVEVTVSTQKAGPVAEREQTAPATTFAPEFSLSSTSNSPVTTSPAHAEARRSRATPLDTLSPFATPEGRMPSVASFTSQHSDIPPTLRGLELLTAMIQSNDPLVDLPGSDQIIPSSSAPAPAPDYARDDVPSVAVESPRTPATAVPEASRTSPGPETSHASHSSAILSPSHSRSPEADGGHLPLRPPLSSSSNGSSSGFPAIARGSSTPTIAPSLKPSQPENPGTLASAPSQVPGTLVPALDVPATLVPAHDVPGTLVPAPEAAPGTLVPAPRPAEQSIKSQSTRSLLNSPSRLSTPSLRRSPHPPLDSPPVSTGMKILGLGSSPSQPDLVPPSSFRRPTSLTRRKSEHDTSRSALGGLGLGLAAPSSTSGPRRSPSGKGFGKFLSRFGSLARRGKDEGASSSPTTPGFATPPGQSSRGRSDPKPVKHIANLSEAFSFPPPSADAVPQAACTPATGVATARRSQSAVPPESRDLSASPRLGEILPVAGWDPQPDREANVQSTSEVAPKQPIPMPYHEPALAATGQPIPVQYQEATAVTAQRPASPPVPEAEAVRPVSPSESQRAKKERRKTGREVVRRTLIFVDDGDEKRKSLLSLAAKRKSLRRPGDAAETEFLDLLKRSSFHASSQAAAMASLEGRKASIEQRQSMDSQSVEHLTFSPSTQRASWYENHSRTSGWARRRSSAASRTTAGSVYSSK